MAVHCRVRVSAAALIALIVVFTAGNRQRLAGNVTQLKWSGGACELEGQDAGSLDRRLPVYQSDHREPDGQYHAQAVPTGNPRPVDNGKIADDPGEATTTNAKFVFWQGIALVLGAPTILAALTFLAKRRYAR